MSDVNEALTTAFGAMDAWGRERWTFATDLEHLDAVGEAVADVVTAADPLSPLKACGVTSDHLLEIAEIIEEPSWRSTSEPRLRKLAAALKECGL